MKQRRKTLKRFCARASERVFLLGPLQIEMSHFEREGRSSGGQQQLQSQPVLAYFGAERDNHFVGRTHHGVLHQLGGAEHGSSASWCHLRAPPGLWQLCVHTLQCTGRAKYEGTPGICVRLLSVNRLLLGCAAFQT